MASEPTGTQAIDRAAQLLCSVVEATNPPSVGELATRAGLPVVLHTPSEVKAAVTGSGTADKAQVGAMVTRLLRLAETPKPADAADALALAICHIWRGAAQDRLARAQAAALARSAGERRRRNSMNWSPL